MRHTAIVIGLLSSLAAHAQWTVVNLHPAGTLSYGSSVGGGQQVGTVGGLQFGPHAGLWTGTAGSWVDLSPTHVPGATISYGNGAGDGQQVGFVAVSGIQRASLWTSTAASWVDLHPAGAVSSSARGVGGHQQVGVAQTGTGFRACLWTGTAASLVDLTPVGSNWARANGTDGSQQVGYAAVDGLERASLWTGSAASWVDLTPAGSFALSEALGVSGGQQVGYAWFGDPGTHYSHAGLWYSTASSWVDLHPNGASESSANGVHGGLQVGWASIGGNNRASMWHGTAASWIDLHAFVPAKSTSSSASGISHDSGLTYIIGTGHNGTTSRDEALMWISRAVAPVSYTPVRGVVTAGNLASLLSSDNNRLVVRPGIVFATGEPSVQIRVDATAPAAFPDGIAFSVESSASFGNAQQKIWLWNYVIGDYELVDTRLATLTDDVTNVIVRTNSSRFIQPGTLAIRALVSYRAIGPAFAYPWSARIDKVWWTFPG